MLRIVNSSEGLFLTKWKLYLWGALSQVGSQLVIIGRQGHNYLTSISQLYSDKQTSINISILSRTYNILFFNHFLNSTCVKHLGHKKDKIQQILSYIENSFKLFRHLHTPVLTTSFSKGLGTWKIPSQGV